MRHDISPAPCTGPPAPSWEEVRSLASALGAAPALLSDLEGLLARLYEHAPSTFEHCLRVGLHAHALAQGTLSSPEVLLALLGGALHDVGKLEVPLGVLHASPFGERERLCMRTHPQAGFTLLVSHDQEVACIAGLHHMFQSDAYGVPVESLLPHLTRSDLERVFKVAELVALCDFFDALTTRSDERQIVLDPTDPALVEEELRERFPTLTREARLLVASMSADASDFLST